jgi:WD40 repeat protein
LTSHYEVLGIRPQAQSEEVRSAYRKLARENHPDLSDDPAANERMARINAAFEVLSDPVRRIEYDASIGHSSSGEAYLDDDSSRKGGFVELRIVSRLLEHQTPVYTLDFEPDSDAMVSGSFDNEVIWWDAARHAAFERRRLDAGVLGSLRALGGGRLSAIGATESQITGWTLRKGRLRSWRRIPAAWAVCAEPAPSSWIAALGSIDQSVEVLDMNSGDTLDRRTAHEGPVTALAWHPGSRLLATGGADAYVKIWTAPELRLRHTIERVRSQVTSLAFSPDGRWLAVGAVDLSVRVFRMKDMSLRQTLFGHQRPVEALAFHPQGRILASAGRDGVIRLWNVFKGLDHGAIEASHLPISCLRFSRAGQVLAAGGLDKVLRVWRVIGDA